MALPETGCIPLPSYDILDFLRVKSSQFALPSDIPMSPIEHDNDVIVANIIIPLNSISNLFSAFAYCVERFREINDSLDEDTANVLKNVDEFIKAQSSKVLPQSSRQDNNNESQSEAANNEVSSTEHNTLINNESPEIAVDEIHREFDNQIRQDRLNERARPVKERNDHEPLDTQAIQSRGVNDIDVSQPGSISNGSEVDPPHVRTREVPFNSDPELSYNNEDGVFRYHPSKDQWTDFDRILQNAKAHANASSGVCKIVIPEVGVLEETTNSTLPYSSYTFRTRENGTIAMRMTPNKAAPPPQQSVDISNLSAAEAVSMFEQRIEQKSGLQHVRYCTDISARTEIERNQFGLPSSPIWPLAGDNLGRTRARVAGLHWPYVYKANSFGAAFGMHQEDWYLYSINYLYKGTKIWIVIPPSAADLFERRFRENYTNERINKCAQFIRHSGSYIPLEVLDRWKVPYKIVQQNAGEAVLTFPRTYHQGFSMESTMAEAVNYADHDWSLGSYADCSPRTCPKGFVSRDMMDARDPDEEQWTADEKKADDQELTDTSQTSNGETEEAEQSNARRRTISKSVKKRKVTKEPYKSSEKVRKTSRGSTPNNPDKIKALSRKEATGILEGVTSKPTIDAGSIYQRLVELQSNKDVIYDDTRTLTLMRLFYAIASPDAICQLRDACHSIREGAFQIMEPTEDIRGDMEALDRLETSDHVISIAKRFRLADLSTKRLKIRERISDRPIRSATKTIQKTDDTVFGRSDALVLAEMMADAYPQLKPTRFRDTKGKDGYGKKLNMLKERLKSGQKWSKLSQAFAPGILALLPTQGEYHVANRE